MSAQFPKEITHNLRCNAADKTITIVDGAWDADIAPHVAYNYCLRNGDIPADEDWSYLTSYKDDNNFVYRYQVS